MFEYRLHRNRRLAYAISGVSSASRIGLSYSSTSTATRRPAFRCSSSSRYPSRSGPVPSVVTCARRSMAFSCSVSAAAEVEPHDRVAHRTVPAVVDMQPREQRLVTLEQFLQRVEEQALAEAAGTRQEVVTAFAEQACDVRRLVHVSSSSAPAPC